MNEKTATVLFALGLLGADIIIGIVAAYLGAGRPLIVVSIFNVLAAICFMVAASINLSRIRR